MSPMQAFLAGPAPLLTASLVVALGLAVRQALAAGRRREVARRLRGAEPDGGALPGRLARLAGPAPRWVGPALSDAGFDAD
ncbi:MAG TPA: hypothetical protein VHH09_04770, partial [Acidimicrobiales bacterium]|nr:hypothetical protein [Acidimicrobiales bacterium]